jgi:3-oxoadipate enol-lactonase/4-carboxymuconolactone decarboxylase
MPFAVSEGCRIFYRLEGEASKPPLVLVHSLGADHGMWDAQAEALSPWFRVLRLDLRGHGASDTTAGEYTIEQLANDVLATVDAALGAVPFAYCGLSMGGMIGQRLAAKTSRITRLVLANTSPRMADPSIFDARRKLVIERGMAAIEEPVMQRFFSERTRRAKDPAAESVRNVLLSTNPAGYAACCSAIREVDHVALLAEIKFPVLVISGTQDVSTPTQGHGDVLGSKIPNARVVELDAAHLSNIDRPAGFNRALFDFLIEPPADPLAAGLNVRRSVLGDAYVDQAILNTTALTRDFQDLITRYAWGTTWTRPGLDRRFRRLMVLAATASLGRWEEFRLHVRTGLENELETVDVEEVLLQTAVYAGIPAANTGFQIAKEESQKVRSIGKPT